MDQFFQWITATPVAGLILLSLVAILVLAGVATYLVAFYQGREVSLWPPKLGSKHIQSYNSGKDIPNKEVLEKDTNRVEARNLHSGGTAEIIKEFKDVENAQHQNRISVPSVHLSSKPIAVVEGVDGPVNQIIYIIVTGHRDIRVGRDTSCDLPIDSKVLSRDHFRFRISLTERSEQAVRGFGFELIDSGSSNGTFLNGGLIRKPTVIENGDLIEAGNCGFIHGLGAHHTPPRLLSLPANFRLCS